MMNCRNCGAASATDGRCDYCGSSAETITAIKGKPINTKALPVGAVMKRLQGGQGSTIVNFMMANPLLFTAAVGSLALVLVRDR